MEEHTLPHGSYSGNGGGSGGGGGGQQRQQPGENFGMFGKLGMPASAAMLISQMSGSEVNGSQLPPQSCGGMLNAGLMHLRHQDTAACISDSASFLAPHLDPFLPPPAPAQRQKQQQWQGAAGEMQWASTAAADQRCSPLPAMVGAPFSSPALPPPSPLSLPLIGCPLPPPGGLPPGGSSLPPGSSLMLPGGSHSGHLFLPPLGDYGFPGVSAAALPPPWPSMPLASLPSASSGVLQLQLPWQLPPDLHQLWQPPGCDSALSWSQQLPPPERCPPASGLSTLPRAAAAALATITSGVPDGLGGMNSSSRTPKRAASRPAISGGAAAAPDAAAGGATATRGRRRRRGSAAAAAAASTIEPGVAAAGQLHPGRPAHDRRRGRRAWRHDDITVAMLSDGGYLDLPIQEAAKKLNVGLSVLKRVCRDIGLVRWPYRKRQSLNNVISKTQTFLAGEQQVGVLATLQRQLAQLTGEGEDLSQGTKSYRQSIFKLNHKINKLNAQGGDGGPQAVAISKAAATRLTHRASLDDAAETAAAEETPPSLPPAIR